MMLMVRRAHHLSSPDRTKKPHLQLAPKEQQLYSILHIIIILVVRRCPVATPPPL